ncbi:MAG: hypothetical protein Q7J27_00970 [Syntrophales bacterium]|nr:hypothetical protein [Syntrophales bacterium]
MEQQNRDIELTFKKSGHFWLDSGLIGLVKMLEEVKTDIQISVSDDKLVLRGPRDNLQSSIKKAYSILVSNYYNLSTKKQETDTSSYNFYYDTVQDKFIPFPKKKAVGIASVVYNKAPRPSVSILKWKEKDWKKQKKEISVNGKKIQRTRPHLPDTHRTLQERMDDFLDKRGLDITTSGLLIDGPNQIRPKVTIKIGAGASKGNCYLCGEPSNLLEDIKETVFPLITGSSGVLSFNSLGGKPEKVCWKCSLLGKFVPVNGFYLSQGENLFAFLPYSTSLEKMVDVFVPLHEAEYRDPNLFRNFDHPLGGYFQRSFEVTFAFLYTLYRKILLHQRSEQDDENTVLDWEEMLHLTTSKAPLDFFVLHMESKGQTTMGKMAWPFRDSVYFFRLMNEVEQTGIDVREVMRLYVDFTQTKNENKALTRNRVCERILKKQTILDLTEAHVFRAELTYFKPLLDFLIIYESIVRKEDDMTKEEQETAVTLGKRVGMAVGGEGKKGDLYALRKTRTKTDFLEQLNRLQFKLGSSFTVPPGVYEGKLTNENFKEFKPFCMIPALNSFNAAQFKSQKGGQS